MLWTKVLCHTLPGSNMNILPDFKSLDKWFLSPEPLFPHLSDEGEEWVNDLLWVLHLTVVNHSDPTWPHSDLVTHGNISFSPLFALVCINCTCSIDLVRPQAKKCVFSEGHRSGCDRQCCLLALVVLLLITSCMWVSDVCLLGVR